MVNLARAVRPVFAGVVESCGQPIHTNVRGAMQQVLAEGHNLRLLDVAVSRDLEPENQDSQHMLYQPKWFSLEVAANSGAGGLPFWGVLLGKDLAPYRIGKLRNPQNRAKIRQKCSKNTIFGIFGVFVLCFACGGHFPFL